MVVRGRVLVSGASVGGPTVAFWLARFGYDVTVIEIATGLRGGGYPVDIRGAAVEAVTRMGLLEQLRAAHIGTRRVSAVTRSGRVIATVPLGSGSKSTDIELPRGELAAVLHEATRERVDYMFGDSITRIEQDRDGVRVELRSGRVGTYDLVVGADGLHSNTRRLVFGPEDRFHRYLGHCFAGFSVPNLFGLDHEAVLANTPGTMATLYAAGTRPELHALLAFRSSLPSRAQLADSHFQLHAVADAFSGATGRTAWLVEQLPTADDRFFDTLSQIRMPGWGRGRVALVGDAAYAPSFLSGQGTSLALVGGYVLAAELTTANGDHARAIDAYERRLRDFVRHNQALAFMSRRLMLPANRTELWLRNRGLRLIRLLPRRSPIGPVRRAASSVELPNPEHDRTD